MAASDNQQFCLKWNNFQTNIMSQFEALKEDEDFVDVTLSCHGQSIKAHKVVLSACSPYLKNLFKENPCKHPVIILEDVTFSDLESLVAFVYTGQVYVAQNELPSFLRAAESLQIRGLTNPNEPQPLLNANLPQVLQNSEAPCSGSLKRQRTVQSASDEEGEAQKQRTMGKRLARRTSHVSVDTEASELRQEGEWSRESEPYAVASVSGEGTSSADSAPPPISVGEMETFGESRKPHSLDPRPCPLCNRVYSNLSNLRQHMRLIHNPTVVMCKICSKTFKTDLYLRRHLVSFHELNLNPLVGSFVSIEPVAGQGGAPAGPAPSGGALWPRLVKPEPPAFKEMFNTNDVYQVPH